MPPKNKNNYGRLFGEALYVLGLPYLFVAGFFGVFLAFVGFGYNPFWASWLSGVVMNTQRYFRYAVLRPARLVLFVGYSIPVVMFFWLPVGWGRSWRISVIIMLVNVAQVVVFYLATYAYDYAQGQRRTEVGRNPLVEFNRRFGGAAVLLSIWAGYLLWRGGWFWRQLVVAGLGMQVFFVVALGLQLLGLWWAYWHYGHERKAVRVERPAYEAPDLAPWEMEYILREGKINVERSFLAYVVRQAQGKNLSFKENIVQIHGTLESSLPDIRRQTEGVFGQERLGFLPLYGVRGGWEKAIGTWLQEKKLLTVRPVLFRPWLGLVLAIGLSFLPAMVLLVFGPALGLFGWFLSRHDKLNGWWTIVVMITTPLLFFGSAAVALYLSNEFGWALDGFDSGPQRVLSLLAFSLLLLVPGYTLVWTTIGRLSARGLYYHQWAKQYAYYLRYVEKEMLNTRNTIEQGLQSYNKHLPYAAQLGYLPNLENWLQQQVAEAQARYK